MAENKKFVRLFEIYTSLVLDGFILKKKLINYNGISQRTFQRDIEEIERYLGIDLKQEQDKYIIDKENFKRLKNGFHFNDNFKENLDIIFTVFMKKVSSNLSLIPNSTIVKLLPQNIDNYYYDIILIASNDINNIPGNSENINNLLSYVKDLNDISFDYYRESGDVTFKVNATAYLIYYFQGIWYLVANDHKKDIIKTYIINNISNISIIDDIKIDDNEYKKRSGKREELIKLLENKRSIYWNEKKLTKTLIKFTSEVAHYFKSRDYGFNQKVKEELEDGSILINFDFSSFTELRIFLSPWIGFCKIISPPEFNDRLIEYLNNALSIMKND